MENLVNVGAKSKMGLYDTFEAYGKSGQVKIWSDSFEVYRIGDKVPEYDGMKTFSIAMREGGFVNIQDCKFHSWTDSAAYEPVFDKYGNIFTIENKGMFEGIMADPYLFSDYEKKTQE